MRTPKGSGNINQQITDALSHFEPEYRCLERCVEQLSTQNRNLVLRYYQEEKAGKLEARRKVAEELGIAVNALRIRAHRIRLALERCIHECLQQDTL